MARDVETLLRAARDELYQSRVITRQLRNQTKTLAAAYFDSEQRVEALIAELETVLDPHAKEAQGRHDHTQELSQAH